MKSVPKLIRRFAGIMLLSTLVILLVNGIAFALLMSKTASNGGPWSMAGKVAESLAKENGVYILSGETNAALAKEGAWAMLIDNDSLSVVWHTELFPQNIPVQYTAGNISELTRGYIQNFPAFTAAKGADLVVVGYPEKSYWKHMYPSWDYDLIANSLNIMAGVFLGNIVLIFIIYMLVNTRLLKSIRPVVEGIEKLPTSEPVYIKERGLLSELADCVNQTSCLLQEKDKALKKKEMARANWICGVSHDIRTPLSVVMGYAGQLEEDPRLDLEAKKKAKVIRRQSERMKNLINDLNLSSKLEYNMQPVKLEPQNAVALVRQIVVDFLNMDIEDKYPIFFDDGENMARSCILGDKALLSRAVCNLIQNCMTHNEDGCQIFVSVKQDKGICRICVEDDGCGVSPQVLTRLKSTPHYMMCDGNTKEPRHGLGLLIVRQIVQVHGGKVTMENGSRGGFKVTVCIPLCK